MVLRLEENKIAARYAKALNEAAVEAGVESKVLDDLKAVQAIFTDLPDLESFLTNPGIPVAEKRQFIASQFEGKVHELVYNAIRLMLENDRISALPGLASRFEDLSNERAQISTAELVTAVDIGDKLEKKIQKSLETMYGLNKVVIQRRVDPGILGGAIIKIKDKVIDGSFVGKLEALRKQIR